MYDLLQGTVNNDVIITLSSWSCGLRPRLTVAASGREYPLCDLSNIVASGQIELWQTTAAKVCFLLDYPFT